MWILRSIPTKEDLKRESAKAGAWEGAASSWEAYSYWNESITYQQKNTSE